MKLVHFADTHLGFRSYTRLTASGFNQREADVATAFSAVIDRTIELKPELVVIGGDVFHAVRPGNPSILHAYKEFSRLMESLPGAEIIMIAGNHDLPRTAETGCILALFKTLGIHVVIDKAERLSFCSGELSVFAVPEGVKPRPKFEPDPAARYNLLLLHGEIEGVIRKGRPKPAGTPSDDVTLNEIADPRWNYIALGHYHSYHQVAPNAFYSGSIEYTSSNIWGEVAEDAKNGTFGKGIVEHDLESGSHQFHRIQSPRSVIDLPAIDATGLTSAEVTAAVLSRIEECKGGIDDQIVRLVVHSIEKHIIRDLDHRMLRGLKARAMHFNFDPRRPDEELQARGIAAPRRRLVLADLLREFLSTRKLSPGIDRTAFVDLGMNYLAQVEEKEKASAIVVESEQAA